MASKQGYGADLRKYLHKRVDIHLNGKRQVAGVIIGYDQYMNLVLDQAKELSAREGPRELGTVAIRGNSIIYWECVD